MMGFPPQIQPRYNMDNSSKVTPLSSSTTTVKSLYGAFQHHHRPLEHNLPSTTARVISEGQSRGTFQHILQNFGIFDHAVLFVMQCQAAVQATVQATMQASLLPQLHQMQPAGNSIQ